MSAQLQVAYRKRSELKPYERNARTHSDRQVRQIADSISKFGFTNPILIDEDGGIIAGHGRWAAAEILGIDEVPTIPLSGLSDEDRRAYILADNKLAMNAGWDQELLALEMGELYELGFEMSLLGWEAAEVETYTGNVPGAEFPTLAGKALPEMREMNFIVHNRQFERINEALKLAKDAGGGESAINKNSNGNALMFICEQFLEQRAGE